MARIGVRVEATEENTKQRDFGNVPNGDFRLEMSASDVKIKNEDTRDQAITISATFDIIEPEEFKGRKIFGNYNVEHPKPVVQEIGQQQFASLLRALGLTESPEDTEDLHFTSFMARIGMGKDSKEKNVDGSPQYPGRNEIKKYYYPDQGDVPDPSIDANQPSAPPTPANDNKPAQRAAAPASRPAAAATGGSKGISWGKK
jgi:hypothetical protein